MFPESSTLVLQLPCCPVKARGTLGKLFYKTSSSSGNQWPSIVSGRIWMTSEQPNESQQIVAAELMAYPELIQYTSVTSSNILTILSYTEIG